jgi:ring-1,2-phenylacetyl-CoA epoxidase subunit PaaC
VTAWPDGAAEYVQTVADTKLVLGQRNAQWALAGPSLEDNIGNASIAQDEFGHVRQLNRLLANQGRSEDWLAGNRQPTEFNNAASLDDVTDGWTTYIGSAAPTDRAAWYLLDAINHEDFGGMIDKIGEDEYFHLSYHDAMLETLATDEPETLQYVLEETLPDVLAFIGPAVYDSKTDPLYQAGFTVQPITALRESFRDHYRSLFNGTSVSVKEVDWEVPTANTWDAYRRRMDSGSVSSALVEQLSGARNEGFVE